MTTIIACVPTQETKDRLVSIFSSSPLSIDFEQLYIPLWVGADDAPNVKHFVSQGPYTATFADFRITMNEDHGAAELSGHMRSLALTARCTNLGQPADFVPRLIFLDHAPPLSRAIRSFLASVKDTLVSREYHPFSFEKDMLIRV